MKETRYIENPFAKIFNIVNPDIKQLYNLLLKHLNRFFTDVKIPSPVVQASLPAKNYEDTSAYVGTAGYIVMFLRLHDFFAKKTQILNEEFTSRVHLVGDEGINRLTDPGFYMKMAQEQYQCLEKYIMTNKRAKNCFSYFMSEVSVWVCGMHIAYRTRNVAMFRENELKILNCRQTLKNNLNKQLWELLYGVPGFLYAILELQKAYDNAEELFKTNFSGIAVELTHMIIMEGVTAYENYSKKKVTVDKLPEDFRLVYYFHKTQYLGGAHGLAGNLNVLLISIKLNDFGADTMYMVNIIKASIHYLMTHLINGNFTHKAGANSTKLVHFCHGAPGIVTALAKFAQMFPEMGIALGLKEVLEVSLNHIWKYGVLKKGFGLCHGISGNAYSFISPSIQQVFHDRTAQFLKKAQFFALLHQEPDVLKAIRQFNFEDRHIRGQSDEPYSLMVGISGDICFTIDVLNGTGYFPGYDL